MELLLGILLTLVVLALAGIAAIALTRTPKPVDGQLLSMMDGLLDRIKADTKPVPEITSDLSLDTANIHDLGGNTGIVMARGFEPARAEVEYAVPKDTVPDDGKEEDATDTI